MKPTPQLTLVSHRLCPYVQRAVTVLEEKGLPYKRVDIDLSNKPSWFSALSPLGKVPLLVVDDDTVLFESAVISEYLNDISGGDLLADKPLNRANDRSWVEFASATINNIAQLYNAKDEQAFAVAKQSLNMKFSQLEHNLPAVLNEGFSAPGYFNGNRFSLVDAAFAPLFRYLEVFESWQEFSFLHHYPNVAAWRVVLFNRAAIKNAVSSRYPQWLAEFVACRPSYLGALAKAYLDSAAESHGDERKCA